MSSLKSFFEKPIVFCVIGMMVLLSVMYLLPRLHDGPATLHSWADQSAIYQAVVEALGGRYPGIVAYGGVSPGMAALGVLAAKVLHHSPLDIAIVWMNRAFFLATVLLFYCLGYWVFSHQLLEKEVNSSPSRFITNAVLCVIVVGYTMVILLGSDLMVFSQLPWSHIPSTFFLVLNVFLLYLLSAKPQSVSISCAICFFLGVSSGFLMETRTHEAILFFLSVVCCTAWKWLIHLVRRRERSISTSFRARALGFVFVAVGVGTALCVVLWLCHMPGLRWHYLSLAENDSYYRESSKIYLSAFPLKLIQLFVDPNFYSWHQNYVSFPLLFGFGYETWKMPLLLQAPVFFFLFPACLLMASVILVKRVHDSLPLLLILAPLLTALGLICVATANGFAGSPHLQNGYMRDFIAAIWLLGIASGPWCIYWVFDKFGWMQRILSKKRITAVAAMGALPCCVVLIAWLMTHRHGLPEFKDYHIDKITYSTACGPSDCGVNVKLLNPAGHQLDLPISKVIIKEDCLLDKRMYSFTIASLGERFPLIPCAQPLKIKFNPVLMGFAQEPQAQPIVFDAVPVHL